MYTVPTKESLLVHIGKAEGDAEWFLGFVGVMIDVHTAMEKLYTEQGMLDLK